MSKNNNDIFNALEILEEYAHSAPNKAIQISKAVFDRKPKKPTVTKMKGFGNLYGKSHADLLVQSVKVLNKIRYLETKQVIQLLERLYFYSDKTLQSEVIKAFEHVAQFNLFVLQQVDYKIQKCILDEMEHWSNKRLLKNIDIVLTVTKELLEPTFEGHSMPDYKTFTLHSGSLVVTEDLKSVRKRAIAILKKGYLLKDDLAVRAKILHTLQGATQTPHSHLYSDDLEQMVFDDTSEIISFYLEILPDAENELIQDIEEQKIWFVRRFTKNRPPKLDELEEAIKSNVAYDMFRVFVGYDGRLNPEYDFELDRQTRTQKVNEFVADISEANFEEWRKKILLVLKNHSTSDPGGYGYLETFLSEMGSNKTDLAIKLIELNEKELSPFLISLLSGIWKAQPDKAKEMISQWVEEGKYLSTWGFIFVIVDDFDLDLFRKILDKSKDTNDTRALNNIFRSILHHYPTNKNLKPIFIEVIKELTKHKDFWWVDNLWFKSSVILNDLTQKEWELVLNGLLLLPQIDYQAEEILKFIADKDPKRVIGLFHDRVEMKSKKKRSIDDRYDGVPFNFHHLGETLRPHAKVIIPEILTWYEDGGKKHNWLFKWEASHLFEEIFPALDPVLEKSLIAIIKKGTKKGRETVFSVLSKYEGGSSLWGVVKALIKQYVGTKEYAEVSGSLFGYLSQTGVVTGEDGFVRAYEGKKQEIQVLKKDSDIRIKKFAKEYEDYLNSRIAFEQKRTNEEIELMNRGLN